MAAVTFKGSPVQTEGEFAKTECEAPDFIATKTDLTDVALKKFRGKIVVLNIFPSLDTTTCANAMRRFNEVANQFPDVSFLCISADLPFAQKRFCLAEHLNNVIPLSIFRHPEFGKTYGVTLTNGPLKGLLSRAVVVIDEKGKVVYTEQVKEIGDEPNYSGMIAALQRLQM